MHSTNPCEIFSFKIIDHWKTLENPSNLTSEERKSRVSSMELREILLFCLSREMFEDEKIV